LLLAEIVSTVGTALTMVALPWFVLTTSGSPARAALVMAAEVAPVALFGVLSGSWAERMGARRWMLLSDGCRAPLVALIPTLSALGMLPFWMLLLAVFALGSFTAPYFASQQVLLAEVVGEDQAALSQATSVLQSATRLTLLIGPPAAGLLIAALGAPAVLYLDAASYLAAVALIATKTPTSGITANAVSTGVLAGLKTLYADRLLGMWTTASLLRARGEIMWGVLRRVGLRFQRVVPVAVEVVAGDRERVDGLLGVSEADGVLVGVEDAVHP